MAYEKKTDGHKNKTTGMNMFMNNINTVLKIINKITIGTAICFAKPTG